jgi:hypothetical protein
MESAGNNDMYIITSANCKQGCHGISTWSFQSKTVHYEDHTLTRAHSTRYRTELQSILIVLYIIYKAESLFPPLDTVSVCFTV